MTEEGRVLVDVVPDSDIFRCDCESELFYTRRGSLYCQKCGLWHKDFDERRE